MGVAEDARAAQDRVIRRSDKAANAALRLWRRVDGADLDGSWGSLGPQVEAVAAATVRANAVSAASLTAKVARADGLSGDVLVPDAFAGVDGSGRDLGSALRGSVITTKQAIKAGMSLPDALMAGGTYLSLMVKTVLADVDRSAAMAAAAGKGYARYVRMVNPGACSRCAILAGSDQFRSNFKRHPACRCSTIPVPDDAPTPAGLFDNPDDYFASLSPAEQERVFTKAGAEAIRLGADPIKVVNARRGANRGRMDGVITYTPSRIQRSVIGRNPDGSPVLGYVTTEGRTRRGSFGRTQERLGGVAQKSTGRYATVQRVRLMPESIVDLTDDVELRRVLLRDAGYTRPVIRDQSSNAWIREMQAQQEADRRVADAFYRSLGIKTS